MNIWLKAHAKVSVVAGLIGLAATAHADWTVTNLHPEGAGTSRVLAIDGGEQVGHARFAGTTRAGNWYGTASSWTDLHPRGASSSRAIGVHNGQQVGEVDGKAAMWSGTAVSWVSLHPQGASSSVARDIHDGIQVGEVDDEAVKWAGDAESLTVLWSQLPLPEFNSSAYSIHNGQIAGWATIDNLPFNHDTAIIWEGESGSFLGTGSNLSIAYGNHDGQQVGRSGFGGALATLWHGSSSAVQLTPENIGAALAVHSGWQVGWSRFDVAGPDHASLWNGTAESWEDLSLALDGSWGDTVAEDVWTDGQTLYVVGWGYNNDTDRIEALMWSRPLPGATIHVPGDYESIQAAIDAAMDGDEIIVAPGTYNEAINLSGKTIALRSSDGPNETTIDATMVNNTRVVTVPAGSGPGTVLEGFTITGGDVTAHQSSPDNDGGGIYVVESTLAIVDCLVENNSANRGGGLFIHTDAAVTVEGTQFNGNLIPSIFGGSGGAHVTANTSATFTDCHFEGNASRGIHVGTNGVAAFESCTFMDTGVGAHITANTSATFTDCHFEGNANRGVNVGTNGMAEFNSCSFVDHHAEIPGGGAHVAANTSATFTDCHFEGNSAILGISPFGGGVAVTTNGVAAFESCSFVDNHALWGGGAFVAHSTSTTFTDCHFEGNTANEGGGVRVTGAAAFESCSFVDNQAFPRGGGAYSGSATFTDCHFEGNTAGFGGGIYPLIDGTFESCTFLNNHAYSFGGGAFVLAPSITFTDCHFEGNTTDGDGGGLLVGPQGMATLEFCSILDNSANDGGGAFIIGAGELNMGTTLICGNTPNHLTGPYNDLGGNEFLDVCPPECAPADLNCDDVVNVLDLFILLEAWGDCPDPNDCPADLDGNGTVDVSDLSILLDNWG